MVLISGRGSNLQAILDQAIRGEGPVDIAAVISNRPGVPGLERALQAGVPALELDHQAFPDRPEFEAALIELIDGQHPDLVILAGFMRILTPGFTGHYRGRLLNIHPSLLPKFPGLHTHERALAAGETEHGATIHFVTEELDGGPIIVQARVPVRPDDNPDALAARVLAQEHRLYPQAIRWFAEGRVRLAANSAVAVGRFRRLNEDLTRSRAMSIAVIAEKPSVARDIAKVLGARQRGQGYLHGNGYVVTWAIGHLVRLAEPHEIQPEWKKWRREALPMLPQRWPLLVSDSTREQFEVVRRILNDEAIQQIVCATDAGREGELIFRYLYEAAGCCKPFSRLWISSLTPDAIRQGFQKLRNGHDFDPLAAAARARSQADWLVGMNLSRAYTLACGVFGEEVLSVGRVQTPTLAMVVDRDLAIRAFVPEDYQEVIATFTPEAPPHPVDKGSEVSVETYRGVWFRGERPEPKAKRLPADGEEAKQIVARAKRGQAAVVLRPHRITAPRQPALQLQRTEHPGHRPEAV